MFYIFGAAIKLYFQTVVIVGNANGLKNTRPLWLNLTNLNFTLLLLGVASSCLKNIYFLYSSNVYINGIGLN